MTPILVVLVALATGGRAAVPAVVPLSPWAGLLRSVTVTVDGTAHPFIFDTGGGTTMITPEVAASSSSTATTWRCGSARWPSLGSGSASSI